MVAISLVFTLVLTENTFTQEARQLLSKYTQSRVQTESELFLTAEKNSQILRDEFLNRRAQPKSAAQIKKDFFSIFEQQKDGLYRIKPEKNDFKHRASVAMLPTSNLTTNFMRDIIIAYDIASEMGPAFRNRYYDTFFPLYGNDANILYLPDTDYAKLTGVTELLVDYESESGSSPLKNPTRSTYWTSVYFDEAVKKWMVSVATPIDGPEGWIGGAGHDVLIDDLIERTENQSIEGTFNLVFNAKGDLIVSQKYSEQIKKSGGQLGLDKITDDDISEISRALRESNEKAATIKTANFVLGFAEIKGPAWRFVSVYPKTLINKHASSTVWIAFIATIFWLLIELMIIWRTLKTEVSNPLEVFINSTKNIFAENSVVKLPLNREDEIGTLAQSFNKMHTEVINTKLGLEDLVTQRTRELEESNQLLVESNRTLDQHYQEQAEFMSIVSHDLKSPLTVILGTAQQTRRRLKNENSDDLISKALDKIEKGAGRMHEIIQSYLTAHRLEFGKIEIQLTQVSSDSLIERFFNFYSDACQKKQLQVNCDNHESLILMVDEALTSQVLDNLISNAVKYCEVGGAVQYSSRAIDGGWEFRISNTGPTLRAEEIPNLFKKYTRLSTRPTAGETSTGLGLSIIKRILDHMNGTVQCLCTENRTEFIVHLSCETQKFDSNQDLAKHG